METIAENILTKTKSPLPAPDFPKLEDKVFGEMIVEMVAAIEYSEEKYLLKLCIQQDIAQLWYATRVFLQANFATTVFNTGLS